MCGISGYIGVQNKDHHHSSHQFSNFEKPQIHRGPDHQATHTFVHHEFEVILSHQRLSIIDLTGAAHQPFEDDNFALVFNGEIYNYIELRDELRSEGENFHTNSDTEVLFRALARWGVEKTLPKCNGMWAFAWLNKKTFDVTLARDRYGVKPLYYFHDKYSHGLYFASEIKTLLTVTGKRFPLNKRLAAAYLLQAALEFDAEETFFEGIYKLPPGCFMTVKTAKLVHAQAHHVSDLWIQRYYRLHVDSQLAHLDFASAQEELADRVQKAVEIRLRSDVPVGVLLSGGLDSSILATLAHRQNSKPVSFLSYVSDDPEFDESPFIKILSRHLQVQPEFVQIDLHTHDLIQDLQQITWFNDQPVHSMASLAHFLLMQKAKEHGITVLLSGQGADEGLCGYRKYWAFYFQNLLRHRSWSALLQELVGFAFEQRGMFRGLSFSEVRRYLPALSRLKSSFIHPELSGQSDNVTLNPLHLMKKDSSEKNDESERALVQLGLKAAETLQERQIRDILHLSVPSLLHYEDRMSMAYAREIRLPFLDYRVVDLSVSLPMHYKLHSGWTKFLLRKTFEPLLPREITWRRDKKGFTNPQVTWLRSQLKSGVQEIFRDRTAQVYQHGLVLQREFLRSYEDFCKGTSFSDDRALFRVLGMELFLKKFQPHLSGV